MDFWISFANFFASAIRLTAPIALGTLACTISERAGVINIGIEGSMLFSGFLAAVGSYYTGSPWVGLLCGCAAGAFLALILGVLAIYCNGQQIVIGIGLNLFGPGFAYMLMRALWDTTGISPWVEGFQAVNIPLLSRIPIAGTMLSGYPACIYLGLLAVAVMQYLLHRTAWGLRIRAVGENPAAVATLGINVYRLRMRAVLLGGVFAGMGGAVMCLSSANVFVNDMSAGSGFMAFAANQRDEVRDLHDVAGALGARPGMKQQTFVAGFSAGAGASAGGIGYNESVAPTLKGSPGGNCMPSVLCLNDQGGSVMECSENVSGTLRAQEHGHQPLVYENHGIDSRYTGPHKVVPTMSARYGTGGNNIPLVEQNAGAICIAGNIVDRQPQNGGNGLGCQEDLAYTLTATDRHAVVELYQKTVGALCRGDEKGIGNQYVSQDKCIINASCSETHHLIRRLTPLECERLQGFPDGWTDIPGASDSARYKALGNSVAIPCVEFIMSRIAAAMRVA